MISRLKQLSAFWQFVILGTATFAVVGFFLSTFIGPTITDFVLEQQKLSVVVFANRLAAEFLRPGDFAAPAAGESAERFQVFIAHLQVPGLFQVNLWNADGLIVYSDQGGFTGKSFPADESFRRALNLETVAELAELDENDPHDFLEAPFGESIRIYSPVTFGASPDVVGVVETHARSGFLTKQIEDIRNTVVWRIALSLTLIFATLSLIVWRASRTVVVQRERLEERTRELEEARATLVASINGLSVGFLIVDAEKNIVLSNPAVEKILGLKEKKRQADEVAKVLGESVDFENYLKRSLVEKKQTEIKEVAFGNKFLRILMGPIVFLGRKDGGEETIGTVVLIEDITETKRLEIFKNEFVAITSHEMRTPLTIIRGNAELLLDLLGKKPEGEPLKKRVDRIHESSVRMLDIVNDFLDLTRLEGGRIQFKKESFDAAELAREVVSELQGEAKEKNLTLIFEESSSLPKVVADRERTEQVFTNLISNAIHYTEKGGVTVSLKKDDGTVKVFVADTGVGIDADRQDTLFQKFQTIGKRFIRSREYGSGLGLYISRLIVDSMGGKIWLEKSQPGKGSVFAAAFPAEK